MEPKKTPNPVLAQPALTDETGPAVSTTDCTGLFPFMLEDPHDSEVMDDIIDTHPSINPETGVKSRQQKR